jgi:hypothetical protein
VVGGLLDSRCSQSDVAQLDGSNIVTEIGSQKSHFVVEGMRFPERELPEELRVPSLSYLKYHLPSQLVDLI